MTPAEAVVMVVVDGTVVDMVGDVVAVVSAVSTAAVVTEVVGDVGVDAVLPAGRLVGRNAVAVVDC